MKKFRFKKLNSFIILFIYAVTFRGLLSEPLEEKKMDDPRIYVLEIAGSLFPTPTVGGPQSIPSILNSIRVASSFIDPLDGVAFAQEAGSSQNTSTFSPRLRYSHSLGDDFFVGFTYAQNEKNSNSRTFVFTNGLVQLDNTSYGVDEIGFKIGVGPLNYLTYDSSYEFAFSYSELSSKGPYNSFEFRSPIFNLTGSEITGSAISIGQVDYRTKNYSLGWGFSTSLYDWLNFYLLGEVGIFTGQLKLSSLTQERIIPSGTTSSTTVLPGTRNRFIGFQSQSGLTGFFGMNFLFEMGFVWRIMDTLGIKYGGFYQFNFFEVGEISGFNLAGGSPPIRLDNVPDLTSALKGKEFGNWGVTIAAVKNF